MTSYTLAEHGFEIVEDVVHTTLLTAAKQGMDKWLLDYCNVDVSTVVAGKKPKTWPLNKHGIIQNYGVNHLQCIWDIRMDPNLVGTAMSKYEANGIKCTSTNDMLVSYDGVCIMYPYSDASIRMMKMTPHLDQSKKVHNTYAFPDHYSFQCIQGLVPIIDMHENHGTFEVYVGSHKYYKDIIDRVGDLWKLSEDDVQYLLEKGCKAHRISAKAGSYVMWDGRTTHSAQVHKKDIPLADRKWRYVVYACYQPRSFCATKDIKRRIKYFEELRGHNHLAANPVLFPKTPRTYGNEDDTKYYDINPVLTPLGRRLVGY